MFSIGHSSHTLQDFLALLRMHEVQAVVDVRSAPYSRYNPQFNKEPLEKGLAASGIKYVFLGRELGARSEDPLCYEKGRVQYRRLMQTDLFRRGIERVIQGACEYRLALMCAEKDPLQCHRTLLVSRALVERGCEVQHILANGSLESHEAAMERLLDLLKLPHGDMFCSKEEWIAKALARQEERIAFANEDMTEDTEGELP